jgi:polyisoprenoid-binding protein YceI
LGTKIELNRYLIDNSGSRFTVRAFASGLLSAFGHNPRIEIRDFTGEVGFAPDALEKGYLRIRIRADSLQVAADISSNDRREMERIMNEEVLEVAKYPEIIYEGSGVSASRVGEGRYRVEVAGNLSLHGVTRNQGISTQVTITGEMLRASGEFSLLQTSYGIKPVAVAGGALKLKDELKFTFDILARRQE